MPDRLRTRRSLEQLEALLDEPAEWKLYGGHGVRVGTMASLRLAVNEAKRLGTGPMGVVAITLAPANDIIVFSAQLTHLANRLAAQ